MKEIKDMLKAMNEKINSLEQKQEQQQFMPRGAGGYRGPRHFRGNYNKRGSFQRGRGQYRPNRPTGSSTFRPATPSYNQRTSGPVNAHLMSWPSKVQNIQNLEIYGREMTLTFNTHIPS